MEGREKVVYFTHDYYTLAHDKNKLLVSTAKLAKEVGVKDLVCVSPIEYDYYEPEKLEQSAQAVRTAAEKEAFGHNAKMTLL